MFPTTYVNRINEQKLRIPYSVYRQTNREVVYARNVTKCVICVD